MGPNRWLPLIWAGTLLLAACSGSNPASPGATNPNLTPPGATTPSRPEAGSEKMTVKGALADARTGEALTKATLIVQLLTSDVFPTQATGSLESSPSVSLDSTASLLPPASAGRQGATAPRRPAPMAEDIKRPKKIAVDDKGQFEIKDMQPGTYQITAYAPGYQALTLVGNRPVQLNMALVPHHQTQGYEISGSVMTAANKPAQGAHVIAGVVPGLSIGDATTAGNDGVFALKDLRKGKTSIAAYLGDASEIKAWAIQGEVPIAVGKDKKTPSPELTIKAVTNPLIFSGKVMTPGKELKPRQVSVALVTDYGEIPLLARTPDKEGYFRFALPPLGEGQTYHLTASGTDSAGDVVYAHQHKLNAGDLKLEISLPAPPKEPKFDPTTTPLSFAWEAYEGTSVYRVRVESVGDEPQTLWEGYSTGTRVLMPDPDVIPLLKKGDKYRMTLTAIKVAEGQPYELASIAAEPWSQASSAAPKEFIFGDVAGDPRKSPVMEGTPSLPTAIEPAPLPKAAPKATLKPSPAPAKKAKAKTKPTKKPAKAPKGADSTP